MLERPGSGIGDSGFDKAKSPPRHDCFPVPMPIDAMTNPQSPIPNPGSGAKRRYFGTDGIRGRVGEAPISADFVPIGRASCRERVCQYGEISVVAVALKKKKENQERQT